MIGKKLKKHLDVFVKEKKQEMIAQVKDPAQQAQIQAMTTDMWVESHLKGMIIQWHGQKEANKLAKELGEIEQEKKAAVKPIDL